jgi:peroxiredoxin
VSKDAVSKQAKFREKYQLPFPRLSDPDGSVCRAYDVIKDKSLYGKIYQGIERSTFVIDGEGIVRKIYRKVKVAGHAQAILDDL